MDEKLGVTYRDLQDLDEIINNIHLKRLPCSSYGNTDTRLTSNVADPNACLPYAQVPPYLNPANELAKFKHYENSGFQRFSKDSFYGLHQTDILSSNNNQHHVS